MTRTNSLPTWYLQTTDYRLRATGYRPRAIRPKVENRHRHVANKKHHVRRQWPTNHQSPNPLFSYLSPLLAHSLKEKKLWNPRPQTRRRRHGIRSRPNIILFPCNLLPILFLSKLTPCRLHTIRVFSCLTSFRLSIPSSSSLISFLLEPPHLGALL